MLNVTHEGVSLTVRPATGADEMLASPIRLVIARHIAPAVPLENLPLRVWELCYVFAQLVCQTDNVTGLSFAWPNRYASDAALFAGYQALFERPENVRLLNAWVGVVERVNRPPEADQKKELTPELTPSSDSGDDLPSNAAQSPAPTG